LDREPADREWRGREIHYRLVDGLDDLLAATRQAPITHQKSQRGHHAAPLRALER
jgi:hypothetical protein